MTLMKSHFQVVSFDALSNFSCFVSLDAALPLPTPLSAAVRRSKSCES
jgi:hypothetical protein